MKRVLALSFLFALLVGNTIFNNVYADECASPEECAQAQQDFDDYKREEADKQVYDSMMSNESTISNDNTSSSTSSDTTSASQGWYSPTGLAGKDFMIDPSMFSPSTKRYAGGTTGNMQALLAMLAKYLLIAITTLATILIIVGGIFMATSAGDHEKASRGKAIVSFNVTAIVIALFSYSIIQLVRWILS